MAHRYAGGSSKKPVAIIIAAAIVVLAAAIVAIVFAVNSGKGGGTGETTQPATSAPKLSQSPTLPNQTKALLRPTNRSHQMDRRAVNLSPAAEKARQLRILSFPQRAQAKRVILTQPTFRIRRLTVIPAQRLR